MDRRETRESVNSGCNCLIISVIVLALVISCARSLINGDIKLPRFGSSHVSGGSGSSGTSNGYNVNYKQTTAPNRNSSLRDYTHTNSQPTEYREGGKNNNQSNNPMITPSNSSNNSHTLPTKSSTSPSINENEYNVSNSIEIIKGYKTCDNCNGKGFVDLGDYWFEGNENGIPCAVCSRTDRHQHERKYMCGKCSGSGKMMILE